MTARENSGSRKQTVIYQRCPCSQFVVKGYSLPFRSLPNYTIIQKNDLNAFQIKSSLPRVTFLWSTGILLTLVFRLFPVLFFSFFLAASFKQHPGNVTLANPLVFKCSCCLPGLISGLMRPTQSIYNITYLHLKIILFLEMYGSDSLVVSTCHCYCVCNSDH